jgi:hypothetical protein
MTRREFVVTLPAAERATFTLQAALVLPVLQVLDSRAKHTAEQLRHFDSSIWEEAVRDFSRCGIQLPYRRTEGEVRRSPAGRPIFTGLDRRAINMVLTGHIPMHWDNGRALAGVTTRYDGCHVCVLALRYAHGHQAPLLSVNTCVHELLHVVLGDIFEDRPPGLSGHGREIRVDWLATRMWLFHDGGAVRSAAETYLDRRRSESAALL